MKIKAKIGIVVLIFGILLLALNHFFGKPIIDFTTPESTFFAIIVLSIWGVVVWILIA